MARKASTYLPAFSDLGRPVEGDCAHAPEGLAI